MDYVNKDDLEQKIDALSTGIHEAKEFFLEVIAQTARRAEREGVLKAHDDIARLFDERARAYLAAGKQDDYQRNVWLATDIRKRKEFLDGK